MQKEAKKKIKELIAKYEAVKESGKILKYSEEDTKTNFIMPLFSVLGWDVFDRNEVTAEEQVSKNRVDYGFYLNGRLKFFLEAKPLKADLHKEDYAKQVIRYSWNRDVTWAVLTDFESIIVFNALSPEKSLHGKKYFEISYKEFLDRFDQLWLLSKESFSDDILDKEAEKHGKKLQKISVTETLAKDLNLCRERLTKSFVACNEKIDRHLIDEGVQKLLDRLIFIRVAEDRGIEPPTLRALIREWQTSDQKGSPYQAMIKKFRELDKIYNSDLFDKHSFEEWNEYGGATENVVEILYGKKNYFEYDFSIIPADVLGSVYENYLGYKPEQSKKDLFGADVTLEKNLRKRKEHGIYYTPKPIVDYIVEHALGPVLDNCKSINDLKKVKILDPACGSGSFLVAAFNYLVKKYEYFHVQPDVFLKISILENNIYGVDLDEQAIELARLNLLLNTFDSQVKLPDLGNNIKNGNSLISGTDEELKNYFGKNFRDRNPFNWKECYSDVFKQGGFDCIIGNPPYGAELSEQEKNYFSQKFNIGSTDTAILFVKHALGLLKDGGRLGFIIPKAFCFASNYKKLRDFVWDYVEEIVDCGKVWKQVKLEQVIVILRKGERLNKYKSSRFSNSNFQLLGEIEKKTAKEFGFFLNSVTDKEVKIAKKIKGSSIFLNSIGNNQRGAMLQKYISEKGDWDAIGGAQIDRFGIRGVKGKIEKSKIDSDQAYIKNNSVLVQNIVAHIENPIDHIKIIACVPDRNNIVILDTLNQITLENNYSAYFIYSLLNSKLVNWYVYRFIFGKAIRTMHFDNSVTACIPILKLSMKYQKPLIEKTKKVISLHKTLLEIPENSEKWKLIKKEIEEADREINRRIYELYELTPKEVKVIEDFNM